MEGHPSFQWESGYPGAKNHVRLPFFKRFKKGADFFRSVLSISVKHHYRVVTPLDGMAIGDFLTAAVSQISFVSVGVEVVHALLVFIPDPYQVGIVGTGVVHDKDFLYPALHVFRDPVEDQRERMGRVISGDINRDSELGGRTTHCSLFTLTALLNSGEKTFQTLNHEVDHPLRQSRIDPDKEGISHNPVRFPKVTVNPAFNVCISRLAENVAAKDRPRLYPGCLQPLDQFPFRDSLFYRDGKAKPGRLRAGIQSGQNDEFLAGLQGLVEPRKITPALCHEFGNPVRLHNTDSRLEIRGLQVIADMRIDVLMIVTLRKIPQLPAEALRAGVGFTRSAPAIPSPIA